MIKKFSSRNQKILKYLDKIFAILFHTKKSNQPLDIRKAKSILIYDLSLIGDMVMFEPFLRILRNNCPEAQIELVCNMAEKIYYEDSGYIDDFIIFNGPQILASVKNMWSGRQSIINLYRRMKEKTYDYTLEPRGDLRIIFLMYFIKAKRKVTYNYTGGNNLVTDLIEPSESIKNLVSDKLYFLKKIGCKFCASEGFPKKNLTDAEKKLNQNFLFENHLIGLYITGIHPGASMEIRKWPYYPELLERLYADSPHQAFLVFVGPQESDLGNLIIKKAVAIGAKAILVQGDLANYFRLIKICNRVICNDSGMAHLAAAHQIPTTIIFGPEEPETSLPYTESKINYITHSCKLKPCKSSQCPLKHNLCLKSITVDEVLKEVLDMKLEEEQIC